jgi:hypothetical protein
MFSVLYNLEHLNLSDILQPWHSCLKIKDCRLILSRKDLVAHLVFVFVLTARIIEPSLLG